MTFHDSKMAVYQSKCNDSKREWRNCGSSHDPCVVATMADAAALSLMKLHHKSKSLCGSVSSTNVETASEPFALTPVAPCPRQRAYSTRPQRTTRCAHRSTPARAHPR